MFRGTRGPRIGVHAKPSAEAAAGQAASARPARESFELLGVAILRCLADPSPSAGTKISPLTALSKRAAIAASSGEERLDFPQSRGKPRPCLDPRISFHRYASRKKSPDRNLDDLVPSVASKPISLTALELRTRFILSHVRLNEKPILALPCAYRGGRFRRDGSNYLKEMVEREGIEPSTPAL